MTTNNGYQIQVEYPRFKEAGGEKSFSLKGGYKSGFGMSRDKAQKLLA